MTLSRSSSLRMSSGTSSGTSAAAVAFLLLAAGAAGTASAAFDVSLRFQVEAISFSGTPSSPYITFPFVGVAGFTDPSDPGNRAELVSGGSHFKGWVNGPYSASSVVHGDVDSLKANLDLNPWTLSITDGATATTRLFNITVSSSLLTGDYIRPMTLLDGVDNGSTIGADHVFHWSMADAAGSLAEYTRASIALYAPGTGTYYGTPFISPADRSWMPDGGPISPGTYSLSIAMFNDRVPQDLIVATAAAADGGEELGAFSTGVTAVTEMYVSDLHVVPGPGSWSLLALGGMLLVGRRR
jgi:hypothetical protein